jgi:hypothetical protein
MVPVSLDLCGLSIRVWAEVSDAFILQLYTVQYLNSDVNMKSCAFFCPAGIEFFLVKELVS